jgi:DNA sulfur modification protein DndB
MNELLLPSVRGSVGDWIYYSSLMKLKDVAERIGFAERIYGNANLSKLVQRELKRKRAKQISDYLIGQPQRFLGSLIVASTGGDPKWFQLTNFGGSGADYLRENLTDEVILSLGILKLAGTEHLFMLDGQHRLAGIQQAIQKKPELADEEVSVIFVAHHETSDGRERTRRLFTTLNKKAVPVHKGEIIALDEDDVMAITTRRLVREYPLFQGSKVSSSTTNNIPRNDNKSFTTLAALYDVLEIIFVKIKAEHDRKTLKGDKPDTFISEKQLDNYYSYAVSFFDELANSFPVIAELYSTNESDLDTFVSKYRHNNGGHVLFRPVGLKAVTEAICAIAQIKTLKETLQLIANCPVELSASPYRDVLFRVADGKVLHKGVSLTSRLLQYMLGQPLNNKQHDKLIEDYCKALGISEDECQLPTV